MSATNDFEDERDPLSGERIAVVGAGISGLACARRLVQNGAAVTVFERESAIGGRLAALADPQGAVDFGAQYVTVREPSFKAFIARAKADGAAVAWEPAGKDRDEEWVVGVPDMTGLVRPLAQGAEVVLDTAVTAIEEAEGGFTLRFAGERPEARFNRVMVALPAPEAQALLGGFGPSFARIPEAILVPCWTLVARFDPPVAAPDLQRDAGDLIWIARNASKPGRGADVIVAQASPAWSRAHVEDAAETVAGVLSEKLGAVVGASPVAAEARLWRYALAEQTLGELFLATPDRRLGACGDWCTAPRVESAYASGAFLADAVVAAKRAEKNGG
jgi:predicted NAD/FAD-dependent oxidoreductase